MVIGITGSSGAGKSTICEILERDYNVKIINADKIARRLSKKGTNYVVDIIKVFGKDIVDEEGELKRRKLAEIIYSNDEMRKKLNNCTFKYIKKEIEKQINKLSSDIVAIIDAPLLFESGLNKVCDKIIGVISNRELQLDRIVARDNIDFEDAEKRLNSQQSNEFYIKNCDDIIENNNNFLSIENNVEKIANKYGLDKYGEETETNITHRCK